jgi:hypothetical protein
MVWTFATVMSQPTPSEASKTIAAIRAKVIRKRDEARAVGNWRDARKWQRMLTKIDQLTHTYGLAWPEEELNALASSGPF